MNYKVYIIELSGYFSWYYRKEKNQPDTVVISELPSGYGKWWKFLFRLACVYKLRFLPLKWVRTWWFDRFFNFDCKEGDSLYVCIQAPRFYLVEGGYVDYLRRKYPGCIIELLISDKYELFNRHYSIFKHDYLKSSFDIVSTYNLEDVARYGFSYYEPDITAMTDYSDIPDDDTVEESDVFFVGREKNRLSLILSVYDKLVQNGLKCVFYVFGVPDNCPEFSGIKYNTYLDYFDVLKHVKRSKCVLNVMQKGSNGITLRDYEAIGMNKYLLTNSDVITKKNGVDTGRIFVFDEQNLDEVVKSLACRLKGSRI